MNRPKFEPSNHPTIYHYCSTSTFLSIIDRRCLWLSDLNTMNDYGEMHWSYDMFIAAVNMVIDVIGEDFIQEVDKIVSESQTRILPMLCAFSTDGDVLSQWRAYAEDGAGLAIGFRSKMILDLSARTEAIEYSREKQIEHFRSWLIATHDLYRRMPEIERATLLFKECASMSTDMAFFKNPAFAEEKEVRTLRAIVVGQDTNGWHLRDEGGSGDRISRKKLPIKFRAARNGGLVSYIELPLSGLGNELIPEVVIGPKSPNNGREISMALNAAGFKGLCN